MNGPSERWIKAPRQGFEPQFPDPKSGVLPLDEREKEAQIPVDPKRSVCARAYDRTQTDNLRRDRAVLSPLSYASGVTEGI